jgi:hypothetical protein
MTLSKFSYVTVAVTVSAALGHSAGFAQSGRIKIVEIAAKDTVLQLKEGEATRTAQNGAFLNANTLICFQTPGKSKVAVLLQQEDGGEARPVEVDASKGCQPVSRLWELSSSLSVRSYLTSLFNFFKREGGVTVRASASTPGGTRGDHKRKDDGGDYCPLHDFKPLSTHRFVFLPEGSHALTFATKITASFVLELVDEKERVLLKAPAKNQRVDMPVFAYQSGQEYYLRSAEQPTCKINVSVEKHDNPNYTFDRALEVTPDLDSAKAFYADLVLNEPLLVLWHAYALSLIRPSGNNAAAPKSDAAWSVFWPYFLKLASDSTK